jgi:hypothetical protein
LGLYEEYDLYNKITQKNRPPVFPPVFLEGANLRLLSKHTSKKKIEQAIDDKRAIW